jgi:hypothetical protein
MIDIDFFTIEVITRKARFTDDKDFIIEYRQFFGILELDIKFLLIVEEIIAVKGILGEDEDE